ncbi:hypothetical protein [Nonomuraea sp. NPDC050786]|uniref:hypothetical protein n=1 Tax=Nonomuraea sp. NPDC050786 TaxID=3154840 RepID=UPI00340E702A
MTDAIEKKIFDEVATLLNLEVDLLFFDTTSAYFQFDQADEPLDRDERGQVLSDDSDAETAAYKGYRAFGKSKDHREDLP